MVKKIKIIFAGTPLFAVPFLKALISEADFEVIGVITQTDKPSGRKQELVPLPVKQLAASCGLKIWQPENIKNNPELLVKLQKAAPDLLVVVAFGQILPPEVLNIAKAASLNVHPSILPKYRGASPIQNAILDGEKETGLSIILMDEKMDHGPILDQKTLALTGEETNESLHQTLAIIGTPFLSATIKKFLEGKIKPQEQNHDLATFCQSITKEDAKIDWSKSALEIKRKIYAFYPWPATWTNWENKRLKIFPPVKVIDETKKSGEVFLWEDSLAISCGQNSLLISQLQLEGKKEMTSQDFLRGYKEIIGQILK